MACELKPRLSVVAWKKVWYREGMEAEVEGVCRWGRAGGEGRGGREEGRGGEGRGGEGRGNSILIVSVLIGVLKLICLLSWKKNSMVTKEGV